MLSSRDVETADFACASEHVCLRFSLFKGFQLQSHALQKRQNQGPRARGAFDASLRKALRVSAAGIASGRQGACAVWRYPQNHGILS